MTYDSHWVKQALLDKGFFDAVLITLPPAPVAVAHCFPRPVDVCATAAEQQVIVPLIFIHRRPAVDPPWGRAFDGEHDGAVIVCRKNVPSEAVVVRLPSNRRVLSRVGSHISCDRRLESKLDARTMSHSSVRLYHPSVLGSMYALLVIFARRRSVSRFETSGPGISSTLQSNDTPRPRMERARASAKAAVDGGRAVRTGEIGMERGCVTV